MDDGSWEKWTVSRDGQKSAWLRCPVRTKADQPEDPFQPIFPEGVDTRWWFDEILVTLFPTCFTSRHITTYKL